MERNSVSAKQLRYKFNKQVSRKAKVVTADRAYVGVPKKWILGEFFIEWFKVRKEFNIKYDTKFDCDNFSGLYKALVQLFFSKSSKVKTDGLALGEIHFTQKDGGGGHSIITAMVEDGEWIFIEPQTGLQIDLSPSEKRSVWFAYFY